MFTLGHRLRRFTWAAWWAVFGLVAAPTLAHAAMAQRVSSGWTEVCSARGSRWVLDGAAVGVAGQPEAAALSHLAHCPLCGVASDPWAPPASVVSPGQVADRVSRVRPPGAGWHLAVQRPTGALARAPPRAI